MSQRTSKVPERALWAVELLDVQADDRILEFGCGPGAAVWLVCDRLDGGRITAIDRSSHAIERSTARNASHITTGRAVLQAVELARFESEPDQFDKAFAINVNVFWTSDADAELAVLTRVLRPGGAVHFVYEGPTPNGARSVGPGIAAKLSHHRLDAEVTQDPTGTMTCITGRLPED